MMTSTVSANGPSPSGSSTSTHSSTGTSTTQACAACKFQRRKCHPECPLAPYFPPDQPKQFLNVHKLYGVSNTLRILKQQVDPAKRHDAMKSILYEAEARDRDPVHGCYGIIRVLQAQVEMLREELDYVRAQQQMLAMAAQGVPYSSNHQLGASSIHHHSISTAYQSPYHYHPQHHEQFTDDSGHANQLLTETKPYHQLFDDTKHYHNNGVEAAVNFSASASCAVPWQAQQLIAVSSPTSATTTPPWFHQYLAPSPRMHTPLGSAVDSAYAAVPQLAMPCSSMGPLPVIKPLASFDVRPSFDARSLVDYETGPQHSFDHDSALKPEHPDESSAESSIKDTQSNLEQEDLESATALFTLTATSQSG